MPVWYFSKAILFIVKMRKHSTEGETSHAAVSVRNGISVVSS